MAKSADYKEGERKGRNGGMVLGILGTLAAGVLLKETCGKNIVDACDKGYNTAKDKVTTKIDEVKASKKSKEAESE